MKNLTSNSIPPFFVVAVFIRSLVTLSSWDGEDREPFEVNRSSTDYLECWIQVPVQWTDRGVIKLVGSIILHVVMTIRVFSSFSLALRASIKCWLLCTEYSVQSVLCALQPAMHDMCKTASHVCSFADEQHQKGTGLIVRLKLMNWSSQSFGTGSKSIKIPSTTLTRSRWNNWPYSALVRLFRGRRVVKVKTANSATSKTIAV